jgi:uroporphyrinogen-III synthase
VKVVVTRPRDQAGELVELLAAQGFDVAVCPLIEIEPIGPARVDVSAYDWVLVTSANGARELARRLRGTPARVAAIGPATARALREYDLEPSVVARESTQEGLLADLPRPAGRVLFAGAEEARRLLVDELDADFVPLYRTRRIRPSDFPEADLVVLASPSAATAYGALGRETAAVSIGPQTSAAARAAGVEIIAEAAAQDAAGLAAAVVAARARVAS